MHFINLVGSDLIFTMDVINDIQSWFSQNNNPDHLNRLIFLVGEDGEGCWAIMSHDQLKQWKPAYRYMQTDQLNFLFKQLT